MKNPIQNKICKITDKYIKEFYSEYVAVCEYVKDLKLVQRNEFASTGSETSYMQQLATEIPETLYNLLKAGLDDEEFKYYKSKEGTEWFARKYNEFSPAIRI